MLFPFLMIKGQTGKDSILFCGNIVYDGDACEATFMYELYIKHNPKQRVPIVFDSEFSPIHSILEAWEESNDASFIETSRMIANKLYVAMGEGLNIPAADLLFVTFQTEGTIYLALLKMNYKRNYNHATIRKGDYKYVGLSRDYSLISATSRVPEAAVVVASLLAQSQRKLLIAPRHAGRRKGKNND